MDDAHLLGHFHYMQEVRGRAGNGRRAKVLHQLYLALCAACAHGQHGRTDALSTVVKAKAASKQAIAIGDLYCVVPT